MDEKYDILFHYGEMGSRIRNVDPDYYSYIDLLDDVTATLLIDVPSSTVVAITVSHFPPGSVEKVKIASDLDVLKMFTYYSGITKEIELHVDFEQNIECGEESSVRLEGGGIGDNTLIVHGQGVDAGGGIGDKTLTVREQEVDAEVRTFDGEMECESDEFEQGDDGYDVFGESDGKLSDFQSDDTGGSLSSGEDNRHVRTIDRLMKGNVFDGNTKKMQFEVGMLFPNVDIFRDALRDYVVQEGFQLVRDRNERTRITAHCGGDGCKWRIHASVLPDDVTFKVKTYTSEHSCVKEGRVSEANSTWIAKKLGKRFRENPDMSLSTMRAALKEKYGIEAGRMQLYRAKQKAIEELEGSHGSSYSKLPFYVAELRRSNPSSLVKIQLDRVSIESTATFKRLFICLHSMKVGFLKGCRPFLGLDGCHLKGPFGGVLLCAVGLDGNDGIFPVAFAIVESETKDSWSFFCSYLYDCIGVLSDNRPWTFMSDGQKGISLAIAEHFPGANHRRCCRHLYNNFKSQHGGIQLRSLFWGAARASFDAEFKRYMNDMKDLNSNAHKWLMDLPLHTWARHKFDPRVKSDHVTNNITESFNNWVGELREKPIVTLVDGIRIKVMKMLQNRYAKGSEWSTIVTKNTMKKLEKLKEKARHCDIVFAGGDEFEVNEGTTRFVVMIDRRTCSCGVWEISGIPCKHAMAALLHRRVNVEYYCDAYFTKNVYLEAYGGMVHPLLDESMWAESMDDRIGPPLLRRLPGRPTKNRRKEPGESSGSTIQRKMHTISCSNCKEFGHNKRKCQRARVARPSSWGRGRERRSSQVASSVGRGRIDGAEGIGPSTQRSWTTSCDR